MGWPGTAVAAAEMRAESPDATIAWTSNNRELPRIVACLNRLFDLSP